jgi:hypothetical protein
VISGKDLEAVRATARPVCQALSEALARHGVPAQILTGNGKVFTARFGPGPGPVMFDRIRTSNGIKHLLTAPYSPATTGKVERLHKTMRAEFFTPHDRTFATVAELQAALNRWVVEYNTTRPRPSCGGRPPAERFALAQASLAADDTAAAEPAPAQAPASRAAKRPAGVSRWVNAHGKISLAGFSYHVGASYAGGAGRGRGGGWAGGHPARRGGRCHPRAAVPQRPECSDRHPPSAKRAAHRCAARS